MSKSTTPFLIAALAATALSAPLSAQARSTVTTATLDATIRGSAVNNRSLVVGALSSSDAIAAAGKLGVSPTQLSDRVAALDDASVNQYAERIRAGGANVVISTTAIIIGLLILILLVG